MQAPRVLEEAAGNATVALQVRGARVRVKKKTHGSILRRDNFRC